MEGTPYWTTKSRSGEEDINRPFWFRSFSFPSTSFPTIDSTPRVQVENRDPGN